MNGSLGPGILSGRPGAESSRCRVFRPWDLTNGDSTGYSLSREHANEGDSRKPGKAES